MQVGAERTGAKAAASAPWSQCMAGHQLPILCLDLCVMPSHEWPVLGGATADHALEGSERTAESSELERVIVATGGAGVLRSNGSTWAISRASPSSPTSA